MNGNGQHRFVQGEARAAYLADLKAAGAAGLSTTAFMAKYGVTRNSVTMTLNASGEVLCRRPHYNLPATWVLREFATADERRKIRQTLTIKPKALALAKDALAATQAREPKITRAKPFVDKRFAFDPPPGWVGQITRDWRERRLQELGQ